MNGLLIDWFYCSKNVQDNILIKLFLACLENGKITKHSYSIFKENTAHLTQRHFGLTH